MRKLACLLLALAGAVVTPAYGQVTTTIGQLPPAANIVGTEIFDVFQNGKDRQASLTSLLGYMQPVLLAQTKALISTLAPVARSGAYTDLTGTPRAGVDYLAPNGSGAGLTGITANQVGAQASLGYTPLAPSGDGSQLKNITAAQVGAATPSALSTAIANLQTYLLGFLQQNYTLQVPSAAALRNLVGFSGVTVHRSGYATAGDEGGADYVFNTTTCTTDDGGSCLNALGGGSWQIDWMSVSQIAKPEMFGTYSSTLDNSTIIQAAFDTGHTVFLSRTYFFFKQLTVKTPGQRIKGINRTVSVLQTDGRFDLTAKGMIVFATGEQGPH